MRPLSLIFAVGRNHVIGRGGGLPWSWPEDREHFDRTTHRHAVIMGRRTWEEIGVALPDRHNLIVTRSPAALHDALPFATLDGALAHAYTLDPSPLVIGGAQLFAAALPLATRVYVTEIPESPEGDTVFVFDTTGFVITDDRATPSGLRFLTYERAR